MGELSFTCSACNQILEDKSKPCPYCGSTKKTYHMKLTTFVGVHSLLKLRHKSPNFKTKGHGHIVLEKMFGSTWSRGLGKFINYLNLKDRKNDKYLEEVSDKETGKIIYRCEEPLSRHKNHGTAKRTD